MSFAPRFRRLFRLDRGAAAVERAVDDELQFHFDESVAALVREGVPLDAATAQVTRRFGDRRRCREELVTIDRGTARRTSRAEWLSAVRQDLHYAMRGLRRKPAFTLGVVLTLGLGIGANAVMFGVIDTLLLRPPAYLDDAGSVNRFYLMRTFDGVERASGNINYTRYLDLRRETSSFAEMMVSFPGSIAVGIGADAREREVQLASASLWRIFTVRPVLGRFFDDVDDRPPFGARVAVLSYEYWRTQYGARENVLGQSVHIGRHDYQIIGVAPRGFFGTATLSPSLFIPVTAGASGEMRSRDGDTKYTTDYDFNWLQVYGRRKPGVSVATANADLTRAYQLSYAAEYRLTPDIGPATTIRPHAIAASVLRERGPQRGKDSQVATWLGGVALIVLVISCANVANLLLARALVRRREIAVRLALGISRRRLLLQMLTESLLLALFGAVAACLVAQWGGSALQQFLLARPGSLLNGRVIAVTFALSALTGLAIGIFPALQAVHGALANTLRSGGRGGTAQRSGFRTGLMVVQGTLSMVLLVGAGLFVRSFHKAQSLGLGYDSEQIIHVMLEMRGMTMDSLQAEALRERLLARARTIPGVENAARMTTVPFWIESDAPIFVEGIDSAAKFGRFEMQSISPEYFATMGTRLLRGRGIEAQDRRGAPLVMVVSQSMAQRLWPGADPLGKCVRVEFDSLPCTTVVGVAEDIRSASLVDDPGQMYYLSITQQYGGDGGINIRTTGSADLLLETVRRAMQEEMPGASYVTVKRMQEIIDPELRSWRLGAMMFTLFGVLALLVSAVGLYSVIAYAVAQRRQEMGIRLAVGAQARDVIRLVMRDGALVGVVSVGLGGAIALGAGRWVSPLLFDTSARDPLVFGVVMVTLLGVALLAAVGPALRAARVDPTTALRSE